VFHEHPKFPTSKFSLFLSLTMTFLMFLYHWGTRAGCKQHWPDVTTPNVKFAKILQLPRKYSSSSIGCSIYRPDIPGPLAQRIKQEILRFQCFPLKVFLQSTIPISLPLPHLLQHSLSAYCLLENVYEWNPDWTVTEHTLFLSPSHMSPPRDEVIHCYEEHEDSVYSAVWSVADAWVFASMSYE